MRPIAGTRFVDLQFSERIQPATARRRVLPHQRSMGPVGSLGSTTGRLLQYKAGRAFALALDNSNYTIRTS